MLDSSALQYLIEHLTIASSADKAVTLRNLLTSPRYDERLLPYLEALLQDQSACVLWLPHHFGEIRWLAAHVLAETRTALNMSQPVAISGIVRPLSLSELAQLQRAAQFKNPKGEIAVYLENFAPLKAMNKLPLLDIEVYGLPDKPNVYRPHQP